MDKDLTTDLKNVVDDIVNTGKAVNKENKEKKDKDVASNLLQIVDDIVNTGKAVLES